MQIMLGHRCCKFFRTEESADRSLGDSLFN